MMAKLFWFWYAVGLVLMLFFEVPQLLSFANGLFLVFFGVYALSLDLKSPRPLKLTMCLALAVFLIAFIAEALGTYSGLWFGHYDYTNVLGFSVLSVPLAISFAWIGVMSCVLALSRFSNKWLRGLEAGFWAVLLDLVLDPVAFEKQFWLWQDGGMYFGVPLQNFVGWFVLAFGLSLLYPKTTEPSPAAHQLIRLYQALTLMFGLLALTVALWWVAMIALLVILLAEGRLRLDNRNQKPII